MVGSPPPYLGSQMQSMPPDFETQFTAECKLDETQSAMDVAGGQETEVSPFSHDAPFTLDQGGGISDVGDTTEGSADMDLSPIDIFQGNSLFGGGEVDESIPEAPPFSVTNAADPPAASPALDHPHRLSPPHSPRDSNGVGDDDNYHVYDLPPYPFELDPVLDPRLGTQIPQSQSPYEYYGSVKDNEEPFNHEWERNGSARGRSESPEDFPRGFAKYEFRDRDRAVATTHLDWDNSGNYDPAQEGRGAKKAAADGAAEGNGGGRKRRSGQTAAPQEEHHRQLDENGEPRQKRPRVYSLAYARLIGASYVFTVSLKSEAGRALALRYRGGDNWPEESYNLMSDEYLAQNLVEFDEGEGEGGEEPGSSGRRKKLLRPRKRHIRYHSPCFDDELPPIPDPLGIEDDLRNHPAARGCIECRMDGKRCSLRNSDATWPCLECQEKHDGEEFVPCELVVRPAKRTPCEACVEEDKKCSYEDAEADAGGACRQCEEEHLTCMAGPDLDSLPKRTTYTPPPGVTYTPYRPFVSCTACRQVKRSCSLKSKQDSPPCRACEKAGIPCTFEKLVPTNAGKQKAAPKTSVVGPGDGRPAKASPAVGGGGPVRLPGGSVVNGVPARPPASNSFAQLPLRSTTSTSSIGSLTRIYSSSSARRFANQAPVKKAASRGGAVAGLTTIIPPSKVSKHRTTITHPGSSAAMPPPTNTSSSTTTTTTARRPTTGEGITTFRSGARTATDAAAARRLQQQQQQQQNTHGASNGRRKADRCTHINPSSTLRHPPSSTKDYKPPADGADLPASYHLLPPPGTHPRDTLPDAAGRAGYYREIVTALAHPVTFDLNPGRPNANNNHHRHRHRPDDADSCRFCRAPAFALLGLSWKKAAVLAWRDGRGFTEVAGGHATFGAAPARMCRACVARRVDVLSCPAAHAEMEGLLPAATAAVADGSAGLERDGRYAEMWGRLVERRRGGGGGEDDDGGDRWCAICPCPAVWRCCSAQGVDDEDDEDDEEDEFGLVAPARGAGAGGGGREGCGLFLCDECKAGWEDCGRDLQELLERKLSTERGVMSCRADAGFLLEEGLLMKNVEAELMGPPPVPTGRR